MTFCYHCGFELNRGNENFCPQCGTNLEEIHIKKVDDVKVEEMLKFKNIKGDIFGVDNKGNNNKF